MAEGAYGQAAGTARTVEVKRTLEEEQIYVDPERVLRGRSRQRVRAHQRGV